MIDFIADICGFTDESTTTMNAVLHQVWMYLSDLTRLMLDKVSDWKLWKDDGIYNAKP
jgi:hypothetical protein